MKIYLFCPIAYNSAGDVKMQRNTWGPTEGEIGDPVGGERGEGNVGDTGGSLRCQGMNRRCQPFLHNFVTPWGKTGGSMMTA